MPGPNTVAVGFVGAGLIARFHAKNLAASPEAEIVACFDIDSARADGFAGEFGGVAVASAAEVLERCDAVYVCTWTSAHDEIVVAAARAGRAVFCEKPLSLNYEAALAMTEVVEEAGVVNQVGLVLRRSPAFRFLHQQVSSGACGPVMNVVFRDDQYLPTQGMYESTWRGDPAKAGAGTLIEHSIHDLDLLSWLLGPVQSIGAHTAHVHELAGIEDQALAWLVSESGSSASLTSIWHSVLSRPSQRRVEVFCRDGLWVLEGDWVGPVCWELADGAAVKLGVAPKGELSGDDLEAAAHAVDGLTTNGDVEFISSVANATEAYPSFRVALEAHRLCDLAYASAAEIAAGDGTSF